MSREDCKDLEGKVIESVEVSKDKEELTIEFKDGTRAIWACYGDCCSRTWIEHLEAPVDVKGARFIEALDGGQTEPYDGHKCVERNYDDKDNGACGHDVLAVYSTHFRTDRGEIVVEFRNDSNGYYGGSLDRRI